MKNITNIKQLFIKEARNTSDEVRKKNICIALIAAALTLLGECGKDLIEFLKMDENAGYVKDSLVIFQNPPTSSNQYKYNTPYMTTAVEGVQGTFPLTYGLADITGENAEGVLLLEEIIDVKSGIGKIVIPAKHDVPMGKYHISIWVENSYQKYVLHSILRIIVKP